MNSAEKFDLLFGGIFSGVGVVLFIVSIGCLISGQLEPVGICAIFMLVFGGVGAGFLIVLIVSLTKKKRILSKGKKYTGKIYGYCEDKSFTMNGDFLVNTRVRYFDEDGIEREAILPTRFTKGTGDFPIGATIDISVLDKSCSWDNKSVRYEEIDREDELMDSKPLEQSKLNMVAVSCRNCGASFTAAQGYVCNCPYCGGAIDN